MMKTCKINSNVFH